LVIKHLLVWFGIAVLAVVNGAARDLLYKPALGDLTAHQLSTVTLMALIAVAAWLAGARWPLASLRAASTVGLCWMLMTLAFEFILGGVLLGRPWASLLRDYDVASGRIWVLVPLCLLVAPMLAIRLRARLSQGRP